MFIECQGKGGLNPAAVNAWLNNDCKKPEKLVNLGVRNGQRLFTTHDNIELERKFLSNVDSLRSAVNQDVIRKTDVDRAIAKKRHSISPSNAGPVGKFKDRVQNKRRTFTLNQDQGEALRYVCDPRSKIKAIDGAAGTGKTEMMAAAVELYKKKGYDVYGCALSGVAARGLKRVTGAECDTLRSTLGRLDKTGKETAKHHAKQLLRAATNKPTYGQNKIKLHDKSLVILDEASMAGNKYFSRLVTHCDRAGATLVCLGDTKQLPAIDAGGAFGALHGRVGGYTLTEVVRQEKKKEHKRVQKIAAGDAEQVLFDMAKEKSLHVAKNGEAARNAVVNKWCERGGLDTPVSHAMFACTNREKDELNALAQRRRLEGKKLSKMRSVEIGEKTFYKGDRIICTKRSRKLDVENGSLGTIVGVRNNALNAAVKIRFDDEKKAREINLRTLLRTDYKDIDLAYAMTVHKGQGRTVDHSYVLLTGDMATRELAYVATSRHRKTLNVFTDENHAGVPLTNVARNAVGEQPIRAKAGLTQDFSPLYRNLAALVRSLWLSSKKRRSHDEADIAQFGCMTGNEILHLPRSAASYHLLLESWAFSSAAG